jgi:hypothetical protein
MKKTGGQKSRDGVPLKKKEKYMLLFVQFRRNEKWEIYSEPANYLKMAIL